MWINVEDVKSKFVNNDQEIVLNECETSLIRKASLIEKLEDIKLRHKISAFTLGHIVRDDKQNDMLTDESVISLELSASWFTPKHPLIRHLWVEMNKCVEKLSFMRKQIKQLIECDKTKDAMKVYEDMLLELNGFLGLITEIISRLEEDCDVMQLEIEKADLIL